VWENPQRFQGNYRESSLAQRGVLPVQLLLPAEPRKWEDLAKQRRHSGPPAASLAAEAGAGWSVAHGPASSRAPRLAQGDGTAGRAVAELAALTHVLQKGCKTSPRQASRLHFIRVL